VPSQDLRSLFSVAVGHHQAGRLDEAERLYREILAAAPDHVDSLHLLGVVASQRGRHAEAIALIGRAIALRPQPAAEFHSNIGLAHRALGQPDQAIRHFERALALKLDYAEAHNNLAAVLKDQGRAAEAEPHCRRLVALKPEAASAHFALGAVLQDLARLDEAAAAYRQALAIDPNYAPARHNLGTVLQEQDRFDAAAEEYRRALALKPDYAEAHFNLGTLLMEQGRIGDALDCYGRAQALKPDYANAHWNEALARLTLGEFRIGWEKYDWRHRRPGHAARAFAAPAWTGEDLTGRTILLHAEQGFGDTIQFVRYARLVKARGAAAVLLECQPGLVRLLADAHGVDRVLPRGEVRLPAFDCHASLLDLPRLFGTELATIPADVPYLRAAPDRVADWRARLSSAPRIGTGLTVGLAWRGNPKNSHDRRRSIAAEVIAQLGGVPGVDWVLLQTDARPDERAALAPLGAVRDCGAELGDWSDTAALVSALDLVISVDTAVAHLAGALGRPV